MTERKTRHARPGPAERPRGLGARRVGEMVPEIGGAAFRRFGFVQSSVVSRWGEIVGARYAGVCAPESIRFPAGKRSDGVLTLIVAGAHAPTMQHVAPTVIERVNRFFGYAAVARLVIRQGVVQPFAARRTLSPARPVATDLGESLRDIPDPELRECLAGLAAALAASTARPVGVPVLGKVR